MNNNRQPNNNNRRRGRSNNNRPQGNNNNRSGFDYQNRIDNRARGNASQMLEKYKKLASDAQHNDDRVNAEYYLQFADHYFRVLADFRSRQEIRQEERRPNREEERDEDRDNASNLQQSVDNDYQADTMAQDNDDADGADSQEHQGQERAPRQERERSERQPRRERTARPPRRHHSEETEDGEQSGLDLAVLPPSISLPSGNDDEEAQAKPARKPRARKPKVADNSDIATAAE